MGYQCRRRRRGPAAPSDLACTRFDPQQQTGIQTRLLPGQDSHLFPDGGGDRPAPHRLRTQAHPVQHQPGRDEPGPLLKQLRAAQHV